MNHSNMETGQISKEVIERAIEEAKKAQLEGHKKIQLQISDYERFKPTLKE